MNRSTLTPPNVLHLDLLEAYGPQAWWSILGHDGIQLSKTGSITGYHLCECPDLKQEFGGGVRAPN